MEHQLMTANDGHQNGFTLVEVMVVLILLTLSFMVFLNALNTGKSVRARSELRTIQSVILNSVENQIRARRFDENVSPPWSSSLGKETSSGEVGLDDFDDIDDFNGYSVSSVSEHPGFSYDVTVNYVTPTSGFPTSQSGQTDFKSIMVRVSHLTISPITDTMIISSGL
tara:strand:- start:514 stop:1017 length:504 start_codon:yes stop_codon:yes gene_type:complete